jgi:hypothetical protein
MVSGGFIEGLSFRVHAAIPQSDGRVADGAILSNAGAPWRYFEVYEEAMI